MFALQVDVLTVEEMLLYTAELKRPPEEPFEHKKAAVSRLVTKLGLERCAATKIGNPLQRGISGGQASHWPACVARCKNFQFLREGFAPGKDREGERLLHLESCPSQQLLIGPTLSSHLG